MSTTYRAAYLVSRHPNGVGTVLTLPEHAGLSDADLRAEAAAEAHRAGIIDMQAADAEAALPNMTQADFEDRLRIGEWTE